jgi:hypothetical protein
LPCDLAVADLAERHRVREPSVLIYAPDLIQPYARAGEPNAAARELAKLDELARSLDRPLVARRGRPPARLSRPGC